MSLHRHRDTNWSWHPWLRGEGEVGRGRKEREGGKEEGREGKEEIRLITYTQRVCVCVCVYTYIMHNACMGQTIQLGQSLQA